MLFCLNADYTAQALNAMRENASTNRQGAVEKLVEAAGGKLVSMYAKASNGPGVMVIFDVPDPQMSAAITGVAVASGAVHNVQLTRLYTTAEMNEIREKRVRISGAYKPPGQA